jgi:hypothetical protein
VAQFHIAGHTKYRKYILDTHDHPVIDPVWKLYEHALRRTGPTATLLEWDAHIPSFQEVHDEALKARRFIENVEAKENRRLSRQSREVSPIATPHGRRGHASALTPRDTMQSRWRDGQPMKKVAAGFIKPNDRLTSFERLEIYNRQYWFRLRDCFYDDYPGLRAVLGDRRFARWRSLLDAASLGILQFAQPGPAFAGVFGSATAMGRPHRQLALDMARLEWAQIEAFDNEAKPPLTMDSLLEIDPARTRLQLQPHLTLLELSHPVDEFLIQIKRAERLRDEASNAMEAHPARCAAGSSGG